MWVSPLSAVLTAAVPPLRIVLAVLAVLMFLIGVAAAVLLVIGLLRKRRTLWLIGLIVLLVSCVCCAAAASFAALYPQVDGGKLPLPLSATPTSAAELPVVPTPVTPPQMPPTPVPSPTLPPSAELSNGPWWLLPATDTLWAVNADGSALTRLLEQHISPFELPRLVAPNGGRVAFISDDPPGSYRQLTLNVLTLPGGEVEQIAALVAPQYEPAADAAPGDPAFEAVRAVAEGSSVAWSPDGSALAFMAVSETPFADLYVYSFDDGSITRLSTLKSQGIHPLWSPQGMQIAFVAVETLGTGAGYAVKGVLVADLTTKKVRNLYEISPKSGGEDLIFWASETSLLVDTWTSLCGRSDLRLFDLARAKPIRLWKNCFAEFAADPRNGTLLTYVDQSLAEFQSLSESGLLFANTAVPEAKFIHSSGESYTINFWPGPDLYSAAGENEVLLIQKDGSLSAMGFPCPYPACNPQIALGGPSWADAGNNAAGNSGLWVGNLGNPGNKVFESPVYHVSWQPGSETLLFIADDGVYLAALDEDFVPRLVSPIETPDLAQSFGDPIWVMP
ncbi:MAG: hypothetical protein HPY45_15675 [Anaerolineae bacterium]|nr:hypothetical protein [Anaerolineae bacterium]